MRHHKTKINKKQLLIAAAVVVVIIVLIIVLGTSLDKGQEMAYTKAPISSTEESVQIGDKFYQPKKQLETILFMGIDKDSDSDSMLNGQCDTLWLLVLDNKDNTYRRININRNTIADVDVLGSEGETVLTDHTQICLAHGQGQTEEQSCENVVKSVEKLFGGLLKIDDYVALNMDAIPALNHYIGGVTVTIEDDFSKEDPSLKMGETIKLSDDQAYTFLRGRMGVADGTNANRQKRQEQYLSVAEPILIDKCKKDLNFAVDLYEGMTPYMVTTLSAGDTSDIAAKMIKYQSLDTLTPDGETTVNEEKHHEEFHADAESLQQIAITVGYKEEEK